MKIIALLLSFFLFFLSSCGTTNISVSDRNTSIYLNNQYYGKGTVTVKRMGPPKKYFIEAKEEDVVVGTLEIKRKFDFATCIIGYFTYGIGLVFAWRFPDTVWVPTSENERRQNFDDAPRNSKPSPWDEPPKSNW